MCTVYICLKTLNGMNAQIKQQAYNIIMIREKETRYSIKLG